MKLYSTTDIGASVRKASSEFTHVVLNRAYTIIKPVYFRSSEIADLPLFEYASWIPESESQLDMWIDAGGILTERDSHPGPMSCIYPDVTVMVEAPYAMDRLKACNERNTEYGVIPQPVSWSTHEDCIDLRFPTSNLLRQIWVIAAGQPFTNSELSLETGIPVAQLQYVKNALNPTETWYIQKRLKPEDRKEFAAAWDWLEGGDMPKVAVRESGFKPQVEAMAKEGYINLKKYQHYPEAEPDWHRVDKKRQDALKDLAAVRTLVDSLPDHLEG